jgi:hypothetical protein
VIYHLLDSLITRVLFFVSSVFRRVFIFAVVFASGLSEATPLPFLTPPR